MRGHCTRKLSRTERDKIEIARATFHGATPGLPNSKSVTAPAGVGPGFGCGPGAGGPVAASIAKIDTCTTVTDATIYGLATIRFLLAMLRHAHDAMGGE